MREDLNLRPPAPEVRFASLCSALSVRCAYQAGASPFDVPQGRAVGPEQRTSQ